MRTFKPGDKVTVQWDAEIKASRADGSAIKISLAPGHTVWLPPSCVTHHEMIELDKPETVVKVDGRCFMLDITRAKGSPRWMSTRNSAYRWSELLTLGQIEVIHESEDV